MIATNVSDTSLQSIVVPVGRINCRIDLFCSSERLYFFRISKTWSSSSAVISVSTSVSCSKRGRLYHALPNRFLFAIFTAVEFPFNSVLFSSRLNVHVLSILRAFLIASNVIFSFEFNNSRRTLS